MANSRVKEEFSRRLKQALSKEAGALGAVRLAKEFNRRHSGKDVSPQGVQKWLTGESIPTAEKLRTLSDWLGVRIAWLRDGEGKESDGLAAHDAATGGYRPQLSDEELLRRYRKLSERHQQAVAEIVSALAGKDSRR